MKRILFLIGFALLIHSSWAQNEQKDTTQTDTTLSGVKMKEIIVTKDKRLPVFISPETKDMGPRQPSLSDIIGRRATDYIMHPFAFKSRKAEKRSHKALKKLWEYDNIKSNNELLREALIKEGIDPDSLMREHAK